MKKGFIPAPIPSGLSIIISADDCLVLPLRAVPLAPALLCKSLATAIAVSGIASMKRECLQHTHSIVT